jgi:hypothetical protein
MMRKEKSVGPARSSRMNPELREFSFPKYFRKKQHLFTTQNFVRRLTYRQHFSLAMKRRQLTEQPEKTWH